jgi:hypothetical protein
MLLFGKGKVNKQVSELTYRYNELKNSDIDAKMQKLKVISEIMKSIRNYTLLSKLIIIV